MSFKSVKAVASHVKDIFKIEMELSDAIRLCKEACELLHVFATGNYVVVDTIVDYKITIQNISSVRAVVDLSCQPPTSVHIEVQDIQFPPQIIFQVPEIETVATPASFELNYINQLKGPYLDFTYDCPVLSFNETDKRVAVKVVSIKRDEDGYPMIPEKAFYACVYYCVYVHQWPLVLLGKVPAGAFQLLQQTKDQKFGQARADLNLEALNQNEMDKLADIMVSMDRKQYNIGI